MSAAAAADVPEIWVKPGTYSLDLGHLVSHCPYLVRIYGAGSKYIYVILYSQNHKTKQNLISLSNFDKDT